MKALARVRWLPLATLALLLALPAKAVEVLQGKIASLGGDDWRIRGLSFSIDLSRDSLPGALRLDLLELTGAAMSFVDVIVECGSVHLSTGQFACLEARYTLELPGAGRQTFSGEASYDRESGVARFLARDLSLAGGRVELRGSASDVALELEFAGSDLQLADLPELAAATGVDPGAISASGTVGLSGTLRLQDGAVHSFFLDARLADASMSNDSGTLVTESMHARVEITASRPDGEWQFAVDLSADAGEAYVEPVYANLGESPLSMTAEGHAAADFSEVALSGFTATQGALIDAGGALLLQVGQGIADSTVSGTIEINESSVDAIYTGLLQVMLSGTAAADLETSGRVAGMLTLADNAVAGLDLVLGDVNVDDRQQRFAVHGLGGTLHWSGAAGSADTAEATRLRWDSAGVYNIPLGPGSLAARIGGDDLELDEPLRLPTMGGALVLERLELRNFGADDASGLLDARLEPIELKQLTSAFGWPAFSGSLSGELPLLQYQDGVVTLGGALSAHAFDGELEFANLRLEEPLGLVPRLYGDLRLRELDLEQVTDTFSFGLIQGRLSGDVTGLQIIGWRPVAMDLHLYTPAGSRAPRRISQRAVENLASVGGGGAAAALSTGFMKFFEEFSYDSIGIRCVLRDGVCRMSGAGAAGDGEFGQGYYIVKGRGLPRIDVVGYRREVNWAALVRQLEAITESGPAVVN